jgi:mRNA-degrading endonuclease YafQ of YafQ-DinJ toxin-antitoxin module
MLTISFKATFVKQMNKLEKALAEEVFEKIDLFKDVKNHKLLKVHKLHGKLSNCFSFSVNYKTRIVFEYETKNEVVFLMIGDHDLYK